MVRRHTLAPGSIDPTSLTPATVVEEFCKISLELIRKGASSSCVPFSLGCLPGPGSTNKAIFKSAAGITAVRCVLLLAFPHKCTDKLKVRVDVVEHGVEGLANLFLEVPAR